MSSRSVGNSRGCQAGDRSTTTGASEMVTNDEGPRERASSPWSFSTCSLSFLISARAMRSWRSRSRSSSRSAFFCSTMIFRSRAAGGVPAALSVPPQDGQAWPEVGVPSGAVNLLPQSQTKIKRHLPLLTHGFPDMGDLGSLRDGGGRFKGEGGRGGPGLRRPESAPSAAFMPPGSSGGLGELFPPSRALTARRMSPPE